MTFGGDTYVDQLCPGSMTNTDTNTIQQSIDECPFHESSLQSSTDTVLNTPESSISTDHEHCYRERECRFTQRLIENT